MSTAAPPVDRPSAPERVRAAAATGRRRVPGPVLVVLGLLAFAAVSVLLRTTAIHAGFWIDEGLSVGISSHPFTDIPSVLRQDGSPPLYYLLLSVWMSVFGDGQATTHALSLLITLVTIPVAWWAGWTLSGARAAWITAALAAVNPFLTYYAQETRMYALVALLALLVVTCFAGAFVQRRRGFVPAFALATTALIYTHNWGLFLAMGTAVTFALCLRLARPEDRRGLVRDGALGYGIVALLYLPWVPSLLFQAAHTGAPWSEKPGLGDVLGPISGILGGGSVPLALALVSGTGLAVLAARHAGGPSEGPAVRPGPDAERRRLLVLALVAVPVAGLVLAWLSSQLSPAYTGRYFAVFVGPVLLLAGLGLAHAGRLGLIALAIVLISWAHPRTEQVNGKSDVRLVAAKIEDSVVPGDLVVSVHPEQAPVLHYYFRPGLRYATALGPMADPQVFDWREALDKLRAAKPTPTLDALVDTMRPGQTIVLVLPIIRTGAWGAPWTALVRKRSAQWQRAANRNDRLIRVGAVPRFGNRPLPRGVRTVLYRVRTSSSPLPRTTVPASVSAG